jgi:hypothetical protein
VFNQSTSNAPTTPTGQRRSTAIMTTPVPPHSNATPAEFAIPDVFSRAKQQRQDVAKPQDPHSPKPSWAAPMPLPSSLQPAATQTINRSQSAVASGMKVTEDVDVCSTDRERLNSSTLQSALLGVHQNTGGGAMARKSLQWASTDPGDPLSSQKNVNNHISVREHTQKNVNNHTSVREQTQKNVNNHISVREHTSDDATPPAERESMTTHMDIESSPKLRLSRQRRNPPPPNVVVPPKPIRLSVVDRNSESSPPRPYHITHHETESTTINSSVLSIAVRNSPIVVVDKTESSTLNQTNSGPLRSSAALHAFEGPSLNSNPFREEYRIPSPRSKAMSTWTHSPGSLLDVLSPPLNMIPSNDEDAPKQAPTPHGKLQWDVTAIKKEGPFVQQWARSPDEKKVDSEGSDFIYEDEDEQQQQSTSFLRRHSSQYSYVSDDFGDAALSFAKSMTEISGSADGSCAHSEGETGEDYAIMPPYSHASDVVATQVVVRQDSTLCSPENIGFSLKNKIMALFGRRNPELSQTKRGGGGTKKSVSHSKSGAAGPNAQAGRRSKSGRRSSAHRSRGGPSGALRVSKEKARPPPPMEYVGQGGGLALDLGLSPEELERRREFLDQISLTAGLSTAVWSESRDDWRGSPRRGSAENNSRKGSVESQWSDVSASWSECQSAIWDMGDVIPGEEDPDLVDKSVEELRAMLKDMLGLEPRYNILAI